MSGRRAEKQDKIRGEGVECDAEVPVSSHSIVWPPRESRLCGGQEVKSDTEWGFRKNCWHG